MRQPQPRRPGERVFDLVMLGLGLFLLGQAHGIAGFEAWSSPGALPLAAAAVMVLAAGWAVLRPRPAAAETSLAAFRRQLLPPRLLLFAALIALFAASLERLGFLVAGTGFLVLAFLALDRRRPLTSIGLALAAVLVLWALFRLVFEVLLPEGILPERAVLAWIEDRLAAWWANR